MGFISMVSPNRGQFPRQGSLNLDELVKYVISAEQNQVGVVQNAAAASSSSSSSSTANVPGQVWKEIVQQGNADADTDHEGSVQRQTTLGETTLEDFLVRAGAINVGSHQNAQPLVAIDPTVAASQQADWLQYQMAAVQQQQQQMAVLGSNMPLAVSMFGNSAVDSGYYPENKFAPSMQMPMPMPSVLATSAESHSANEKKTIEKKQKRMIKNRESAARSRARKQAYNNKLVHDAAQLMEANEELKKEKEMWMLFPFDPTPEPKYQLRRTSSAQF